MWWLFGKKRCFFFFFRWDKKCEQRSTGKDDMYRFSFQPTMLVRWWCIMAPSVLVFSPLWGLFRSTIFWIRSNFLWAFFRLGSNSPQVLFISGSSLFFLIDSTSWVQVGLFQIWSKDLYYGQFKGWNLPDLRGIRLLYTFLHCVLKIA